MTFITLNRYVRVYRSIANRSSDYHTGTQVAMKLLTYGSKHLERLHHLYCTVALRV